MTLVPTPLDMPQVRPDIPAPRYSVEDLRAAGTAVAEAMTHAVRLLRLSGASWAEVGARLGVTKQSAHRKYAHVDAVEIMLCVEGKGAARVAYLRDPMTGVEFREPQALARAGVQAIEAARTLEHDAQQP